MAGRAAAPGSADDSTLLHRLQRRLESVGKVLSHDFPNQLVIVQGLLQLLTLEENDRLSADGREYLRRLGGACTRALDLAQGLKILARLEVTHGRVERVVLDDLAAEVAAEIKKLRPGTTIEYHSPQEASAVKASRRPLQQALVELVGLTATLTEAGVVLDARTTDNAVEIGIGGTAAAEVRVPEGRLEYLLARELVDVGGGVLRPGDPARRRLFAIAVPAWPYQGIGPKDV